MTGRVAGRVIVPDVVGLPFHVGRDVAETAGVALANPDPDSAHAVLEREDLAGPADQDRA
jgi:hypothetical protein